MTASFNQEELKILEQQYEAIQRQSHDTESIATPNRPNPFGTKLQASPLISKTMLRADLDESAVLIEHTEDDIARKSQVQMDDIRGSAMLSSVLVHDKSAYSYSLTDNTPIRSPGQINTRDLAEKNQKLEAEVADFQAILKTQHSLL